MADFVVKKLNRNFLKKVLHLIYLFAIMIFARLKKLAKTRKNQAVLNFLKKVLDIRVAT